MGELPGQRRCLRSGLRTAPPDRRYRSGERKLGPVELRRPYFLCIDCSKGQYPIDTELGIAGLESSPGVRRMEAVVGSEMPFASACEPMKLLAGLDVTAKRPLLADFVTNLG